MLFYWILIKICFGYALDFAMKNSASRHYGRDGNWACIARLARMGKFCSAGAYFTTSDHIEFGQIFLISIF